MKLTFLGTGTSVGVPTIGCSCRVCTSTDARDRRLRAAALLETDTTRVLIDCGPDFRQQLMPLPFRRIDGVLITHAHYDHMGGMDDLRPFCRFGTIPVWADALACEGLHQMLPYCFGENLYPGVPHIELHDAVPHMPLQIGDIDVLPLRVMHAKMPILGFRFGSLAYITDMKTISDDELPYLEGIDTLVVNALRFRPDHHSHLMVDDAIAFARRTGARRTFLTHMCHDIGLHEEVNNRLLPSDIQLAHDGLVIEC